MHLLKNAKLVNLFLYNISSSLPFALNIVLFPLYTQYLSPEEYGKRAIVAMAIFLFECLSNVGQYLLVKSQYFACKDEFERKSFLSTFMVFSFALRGLLSLLLIYILVDFLPYVFPQWGASLIPLLHLQIIFFFMSSGENILSQIFVMQKRGGTESTLRVSSYLFGIFLSLILITVFQFKVEALFWADIIRSGVYFLTAFFILNNHFGLCFSKKSFLFIIKHGVPLIPNSILNQMQGRFSEYLLQYFIPLDQLGLYNRSTFLLNIYASFNEAFDKAISPDYMRLKKIGVPEENSSKMMLYYIFFTSLTLLTAIFFLKDFFIMIHLSQSFWDICIYAPLICIPIMIFGQQIPYSNNILLAHETKYLFYRSLLGTTVNIFSNLLLIPSFQIIGSVVASLFSSSVIVLYSYFVSEKIIEAQTKLFNSLFIIFVIYTSFWGFMAYYYDLHLILKISVLLGTTALIFAKFFVPQNYKKRATSSA